VGVEMVCIGVFVMAYCLLQTNYRRLSFALKKLHALRGAAHTPAAPLRYASASLPLPRERAAAAAGGRRRRIA